MIQTIVQKFAGRRSTIRAAEHRFIVIALVPTIIFYVIVKFYPIFFSFFISMHEWSLFGNVSPFVGFDNYAILVKDSLFYKVMWNTMYRTFAGTFLGAFCSLIVALILNPIKRGSILLRLIYFLPVMTSVIASATIWKWMLQTRFGLLNQLLSYYGHPASPLAPVHHLGHAQHHRDGHLGRDRLYRHYISRRIEGYPQRLLRSRRN